eukprot:64135-Chlamydomonas_euryale.AAC.1
MPCVPAELTVTLFRRPEWPDSTCVHLPRAVSHTRAVESWDAVTTSSVVPMNSTDTTLARAMTTRGRAEGVAGGWG